MVAWILPIFRQIKTKWIFFFLVLGLLDPFVDFSRLYLDWTGFWRYNLGSLLLYLSLYKVEGKKFKEIDYLLIIMLVSTMIMLQEGVYFLLIAHAIIFYKIFSYAVIELHHKDTLNFSLLVLVLYELSILTKFIAYLNGDHLSYVLFSITLFFEIAIALFFTIFRIDDARLMKYLKQRV